MPISTCTMCHNRIAHNEDFTLTLKDPGTGEPNRKHEEFMSMTACFLPKPVTGVNGNGMHTNLSLARDGKNLFWDPNGEDKVSKMAWEFIDRILTSANDICLVLNASVNAYRRLDPHYEAPNQIKASAINRGAMVRIPLGNERSARIEVPFITNSPTALRSFVHAPPFS